MTPVFIDVETFWSKTHALRKMTAIEYVLHADTQIICGTIKVADQPTQFYWGEVEYWTALHALDLSKIMLVGHNMSEFDALVLEWRLKVRPRMWGCTLAMARPIHAKTVGLSLAKLVEHYGLGTKDAAVLVETQGKRAEEFTPDERVRMRTYNIADTDQCAQLFHILKAHYDAKELWHIDATVRMIVEPQLEVDVGLLSVALSVERSNKQRALHALAKLTTLDQPKNWDDEAALLEQVRQEMASAPKFASLLRSRGVPVPTKPSPTDPKKRIPALAKSDKDFIDLQESDDEVVSAAVRARLAVKSTLLETRINAFVATAKLCGGLLPIPAKYCGADTTGRLSGFWYNPLNLPRVNPKAPKVSDALRRSLRAPKGYTMVVADLSGIELRFNHCMWQVPYSTAMWKADATADLYRAYGAMVLGCSPDDITKEQRFYFKVVNLATGYGMGPLKMRATARIQGGLALWIHLNSEDGRTFKTLDDELAAEMAATPEWAIVRDEADEAVKQWRDKHPEIIAGWRSCHMALQHIRAGQEVDIDPAGLMRTCKEGIIGPTGRLIRYPHLREETRQEWNEERQRHVTKSEWVYGDGRHKTRIYGGKIDENICQFGSRDVIYDHALRVYKETGYRYLWQVYDELVYLVPDSEADAMLKTVLAIMHTPPSWWRDIVLAAEGDIGHSYADAK